MPRRLGYGHRPTHPEERDIAFRVKPSAKPSRLRPLVDGGLLRAASPHPKRPAIVVHAEAPWCGSIAAGKFDFFEKLAAHAQTLGINSFVVDESSDASHTLLQAHHLHIMVGVSLTSHRAAFHAMPSYLWGFWYLDPKGVQWNASLCETPFEPETVDPDAASYFFNGVSGYTLRENRSKFDQPARQSAPLPPARAVIFLQEIEKYRTPVHYLDTAQMVSAVARATPERVYVKLHPAQSPRFRTRFLALCDAFDNVVVTEHSLHDLIAASEVVVSQNSAAGFEALLHKTPVITCARTDYHHATVVARSADTLAEAVHTAPDTQRDFPYERYVYWYLGQHMLEPQKPEFEARAWARIGGFFAPPAGQ